MRLAFLIMTLLVMVFTPLVAAAAAATPVPQVGAPDLFTLVSLMGLGAGVIGLTLQLQATNEEGDEETIQLDSEDKDSFTKRLKRYVKLRIDQAVKPVKVDLTAAQTENEDLRGIIVGEIVRVRQLSAEKAEAEFDAEAETAYLQGLPAERLKMEYDRTPKQVTKPQAKTTGEIPSEDEDAWADLVA